MLHMKERGERLYILAESRILKKWSKILICLQEFSLKECLNENSCWHQMAFYVWQIDLEMFGKYTFEGYLV